MNKLVSVTLISMIPWNIQPISLTIDLVHFGLYEPFIRCIHSWDFTVSGQMIAFIIPGWILTLPVVLFMCTHSSPVLCTFMLVGVGIAILLGLGTVVTRLDMQLCPCRRLDLVLYMCTIGTLKVIP